MSSQQSKNNQNGNYTKSFKDLLMACRVGNLKNVERYCNKSFHFNVKEQF